jgi:hypothetical protein
MICCSRGDGFCALLFKSKMGRYSIGKRIMLICRFGSASADNVFLVLA